MTQPTYTSDGGYRTYSNYSGAVGPDLLITSGAGRLNQILQHTQMTSGQPVLFYDSAAPVSGGPLAASDHRVIGVLPATYPLGAVASGNYTPNAQFNGTPIQVDMPFSSGLSFTMKSGAPGFTVSWTPEKPLV